ncbi:MAG: hypothetical protein Q8O52_01685 [Sulfuritalea sp.]|nr:hypothetical protein [Sulfuritalea sp.]
MIALRFGDGLLRFAGEQFHRRTVVHDGLAPEQVQRLDAVRAFMDGIEAVVAVELLDQSCAAAMKPASQKAFSASPTSGIMDTLRPSKLGSCSSALRLCGANFSLAIASAVSSTARKVSLLCSA